MSIEEIINKIAWWIPFKSLRNAIRGYLLYIVNLVTIINQTNLELNKRLVQLDNNVANIHKDTFSKLDKSNKDIFSKLDNSNKDTFSKLEKTNKEAFDKLDKSNKDTFSKLEKSHKDTFSKLEKYNKDTFNKLDIINKKDIEIYNFISKLKNEISVLDLRSKARMQILALYDNKIIEENRKEKLIISLTTFPQRIYDIDVVLFSLLNQTVKPDKIILWLGKEEFPNLENDVPNHILNMRRFGIDIEFCKDIKPYKKLIYTLEKYPNDVIVTADDDTYYEYNWLEKLYNAYLENPNYIHCHRAHKIQFDEYRNILPYTKWIECIKSEDTVPSFTNFFTGVGGVLYKSELLYKDILNESLFMELCPKADDIWFWAMAVLNDTKINVVKDNINKVTEIGYDSYVKLWHLNKLQNFNDVQLNNIFNYYGELLTNKINNEILP